MSDLPGPFGPLAVLPRSVTAAIQQVLPRIGIVCCETALPAESAKQGMLYIHRAYYSLTGVVRAAKGGEADAKKLTEEALLLAAAALKFATDVAIAAGDAGPGVKVTTAKSPTCLADELTEP